MRPDIEADFDWQRRFVPSFKRIMGEHLIAEAPFEEDTERATDLIVLRLEAIRVGCRVRQHQYLLRYPDDFTIRCSRPNGAATELAKIIAGWGDYTLYAFADEADRDLAAWTLGDLSVFRLWHQRETVRTGRAPGQRRTNTDGSSDFMVYRISELPAEFVVARRAAGDLARAA